MTRHIEVHICSHYTPARIPPLTAVLEAMLGWRRCAVEAVITSNNDAYLQHDFLPQLQARFARAGHVLRLHVASDLPHPFELTWEHKKFIPVWLQRASEGDLFIYIEDDIVLTNDNLLYYVRNLEVLEAANLIPGFLRYEIKDGERRVVDLDRPEYWERDRTVSVGGSIYHACINPYWAGFILDPSLATEYVASRSFTIEESKFYPWDVRARAAMGLNFEHPDPRLRTRTVIPIVDDAPDPGCLVWHSANNYTAMDHPVLGRLPLDKAFPRESLGQYLLRKARGAPGRLDRMIRGDPRWRTIKQYGEPSRRDGDRRNQP